LQYGQASTDAMNGQPRERGRKVTPQDELIRYPQDALSTSTTRFADAAAKSAMKWPTTTWR
jgi:hypothetical protein